MMRRNLLTALLTIVSIAGLQACSDTKAQADEAQLAIAEVLANTDIAETSIRLTQAVAAEWNDSSLDCGKKGEAHMPIVTAGHIVKVLSDTTTYTVHVANGRAVLCDQAQRQSPNSPPERDKTILDLVQIARQDLEHRQGDNSAPIVLQSMQAVRWGADGPNCDSQPSAGESGDQGAIIILESAGKSFVYRADSDRLELCEPEG